MERWPQAAGGLEEIFDEKLKAYATLDYKESRNPVDFYQSGLVAKQEQVRACSRERASPTLFLARGRQSPTVLSSLNLNSPNLINPNCRRSNPCFKPDPWSLNQSHPSDLNVDCLANIPGIGGVNQSFTRPSTPCESSSISPKRHVSPFLRGKVLANRDKESLMDEIIGLKKALLDQSATLQRHKVMSSNLELENRKLEKEIEELICQSNNKSGVKPSAPPAYDNRLRSKVQGLKRRISQLEATCEMQQEELTRLRRDVRVTRTRELEAERDVFAEEIERLQNFLRRLQILQNRLFCENKQLWRYKDRNTQLEASAQRLENSSHDLQKSLEKANKEIHETTRKGNESFIRAKRAERQCQDLQEQASLLSKVVEKEKSEKLKLQQMIHVLQDEVQNLEASLSTKVNLQGMANLDSNPPEEQHQPGILAKTWGFLHGNPFHKTRELDFECENMVLGERPKTRGEQRNKLASGGADTEAKKSRPKSPTKPAVNKRAIEATKLQPRTVDLPQQQAQEGGERRNSSASKNQRREDEQAGERTSETKPTHTVTDPNRRTSSSKQPIAEPSRRANPENTDVILGNEIRRKTEEAEIHKETIAEVVEGMVSLQEGGLTHGGEPRVGEAAVSMVAEGASSAMAKPALTVLVPRLNLQQVGPATHHMEETNSESSNAIHTSATNSNKLSPSQSEQAHQKVIAWDDNINAALIHSPAKLALIKESRTPNND